MAKVRLRTRILDRFAEKNYFFRHVIDAVRLKRKKRYYKKYCLPLETDDRLVLFESFFAKEYACSPKAIYEEMLNNPDYSDFRFVWIFRKPGQMRDLVSDPRTTLLQYDTKRCWRAYSRAKYWVLNSRVADFIEKKDDQVFIETWHGTPLKRLGFDIKHNGNPLTKQSDANRVYYLENAKKFDYFVSPSRFCTDAFTTAFGLDQLGKQNILIETGYPRNDALFHLTKEKETELKKQLGIPLDKTILLYAPTWRDNHHKLGVGFTFDATHLIRELIDQLPADYFLIVRLHYLIANKIDLTNDREKALDYSNLGDINDLYAISDILITDYSSVFFDYANLRRPILFYMYDLEEYRDQIRDFYFDLEELPGPIVKTQQELLDAILNIDQIRDEYGERYERFRQKFNYLDDGNASLRVIRQCIR